MTSAMPTNADTEPIMDDETFSKRLTKARGSMSFDAVMFATLAFNLGLKRAGAKTKIPTVDGEVFSFPDEFVASATDDQLKGVLAAGSLACGLGHPFRRGARKAERWNMASSMITGVAAREAGFELPPTWPAHPDISPSVTIEQAYKILEEEESEDGDGEGEGEGGGGGGGVGVQPPQGGGNQDQDGDQDGDQQQQQQPPQGGMERDKQRKLEQDWAVKMVQAAQVAQKMQGSVPGWMKGMIDELTNPKVDWRQVLRNFLEETTKDDYSFTRRNRRYSGEDFSFPGLHSEGKPRLIVAMDYSGSVSKLERRQFLSELNAMLEEFDMEITVVYFDSDIQGVKKYTREDLPIKDDSGYGGTYFPVPFKWVEENVDRDPTAMIVCSDMECGSFPDRVPSFPVLWVSTQPVDSVKCYWPDNEIPFGQIIEIDVPHGYGY